MDKINIIIDTDIGDDIDDAFAIALAVNSPELSVLGVTTVARNSYVKAKIASKLISLYNRSIPVFAGEDAPLNAPVIMLPGDKIGEDNKPIVKLYDESMADAKVESTLAADYILEEIECHPNEVIILAIGPLTNLARAYQKSPETFRKLKGIHMMGGDPVSDYREWNMACDPIAADIVFGSGVPITMVGINVTMSCTFTDDDVHFFESLKHPGNRLLARMMSKWLATNIHGHLPTMHDGLAAACLFKDFCGFTYLPLSIVKEGGSRGRTQVVTDKNTPSVSVKAAMSVDGRAFIEFLKKRLSQDFNVPRVYGNIGKIKLISQSVTMEPPSDTREYEQRLTITKNGRVYFSSYGYYNQKLGGKNFSVKPEIAQEVFAEIKRYFEEPTESEILCDVGSWHIELTNDEGQKFKFTGTLLSEENELDDISELIRRKLDMRNLLAFDGGRGEYIFVSVRFEGSEKSYYYLSDGQEPEEGDYVVVPVGPDDREAIAEVVDIEYYYLWEAPIPPEKVKKIIRRAER